MELSISNKNSKHASIGDELIIKATASEGIVTKKILINGREVNHMDLTESQFYANYFFKDSDNDGIVNFEINFSDSSGNQGVVVKSSTDGNNIIFDKTHPSILLQVQLFQMVGILSLIVGTLPTLIW